MLQSLLCAKKFLANLILFQRIARRLFPGAPFLEARRCKLLWLWLHAPEDAPMQTTPAVPEHDPLLKLITPDFWPLRRAI